MKIIPYTAMINVTKSNEVIATPINSNKFTDFDLRKVKTLTGKIKKPKKPKIPTFQVS